MNDVLDLGTLDGPVLVFGGPYGNLQAAAAMQMQARRLGIGPERCLCTGDIAAYCADPEATLDLIRAWGVHVVMGNCEESLAAAAAECGCNFNAGSVCEVLSKQWYAHALSHLDGDRRAWLGRRPRMIRFTLAGRRVAAIHGGVDEIGRYVYASTDAAVKHRELAAAGADMIVAGHSGLPFTEVLEDGRVWHNPGALGMPANDGTADVWYAMLTPATDGIAVSHHRLSYDHRGAARSLRDAGLADAYADALEHGRWPSLDLLPPRERGQAGRPLLAERLHTGPDARSARPNAA